jgi:dipeptidyl-peptidase-4
MPRRRNSITPRPGKQNVQVRLGIVGVAGGPTQWIDWDRQQYEYLAAVDWLPEGLYVTVQNRLQTELVVLKVVDAADGRKQTQPLLTET